MKRYIFVLIIFCFIINSFGVERERNEIISKEIVIDYIPVVSTVLDGWKTPGLYSPANMFDGDTNTCFAVSHVKPGLNSIHSRIEFKNPVYVDEIRIMNGFGKNEIYFKNNNRLKKLLVSIPPRVGQETLLTLEDKKEFQSFKFDKSYLLQIFYLSNDGRDENIYKGEKYDDTCITEIEFYNKGEKIPVKNTSEAKKDYIDRIGAHLNYVVSGGQNKYMKYKWKVENRKLYKYKNGEWLLTKYFISGDDSIEVFDENGNCNKFGDDLEKCTVFNRKEGK